MTEVLDLGGASFSYRPFTGDRDILEHVYTKNGYGLPDDLQGLTLVDVGAHIGGVSVLASQRGANVISFEACKDNVDLCALNMRVNAKGPFQVKHGGIGAEGVRPLYLSGNNSGQHSEFLVDPYWDAGLKPDVFEMVTFIPLRVATSNLLDFHLKLDCEGSEVGIVEEILGGLHERIPVIYVEFQTPEKYNVQLEALGRFYDIISLGSNEYRMERR